MASMGVDIARDILLRLPTRDLASCSCVCKLWRDVVGDPDFRTLHGDDDVSSGSGETLLVSEFHGLGMGSQLIVLRATSGTPIRRLGELPAGYSPANACNGYLLLASAALDSPVCVCNPITGETLWIPPPPENKRVKRCTYAMGFSESSTGRMYKLFRLSFPVTAQPTTQDCYLDVYTLGAGGDGGGWRRHPREFRAVYKLHTPPPVLLDGKLYMVIKWPVNSLAPDSMMLIDVASEEHRIYSLPEQFTGLDDAAAVHAFDLSGKLCVAIRAIGRRRISFWVLKKLVVYRLNWRMPDWERRYTFHLDADGEYGDKPCCAWLDGGCDDGMLCYRFGDRLYEYNVNTTKKKRIQLPSTLFAPPVDQRWNVHGGYRPSLLSPHIAFITSGSLLQQHREKQEQFVQTLQNAMRARRQPSSKKRCSTCPPDCSNNHRHGAKRIRKPAP